jgi:hypothetical protein
MVYLALFGAGKIILNQAALGLALLAGAAACALLLYREIFRRWGAETAAADSARASS